jgi:hypothetical protein
MSPADASPYRRSARPSRDEGDETESVVDTAIMVGLTVLLGTSVTRALLPLFTSRSFGLEEAAAAVVSVLVALLLPRSVRAWQSGRGARRALR